VKSITTTARQTLYLDKLDMEAMSGKRILIVDDVISTGESLAALEQLVQKAGGNIVAKMAILAEGDAKDREDILYLEYLPLFDNQGNPL
ncbi:MAG: adenine phosphoribosyltransferase, partial [Clostridia bacterium]|nr:adenine phosphoribosyltransferase [Clostridia bacterium]